MKLVRGIAATASAIALGVVRTAMHRGERLAELKPGDPAPDFALQGSDGRVHRLSDLGGRPVVLAWFPKAFTGG